MTTRCYLFDVDGTLADIEHRLHHIQKSPKDWRSFFADCVGDKPIKHMCELAQNLWMANEQIVFVSGRSDEVRTLTQMWLSANVTDAPLYMRKAGDFRPDHVVKAELLDAILADGYEPIMVFDDRKQVVDMWRARGIPCAQVTEGDF